MAELKLGYASSIHTSQVQEYPVVVIPIVMEHGLMLTRRLLLAGCSRGRRMLVLVGHVLIDALARAVNNTRRDARHTQLRALLEAAR